MKEKVQLGIGAMFAVAMVVFFALGKIPLNVFLPVVTGALVWLFKDIEQARMLKRIDALISLLESKKEAP